MGDSAIIKLVSRLAANFTIYYSQSTTHRLFEALAKRLKLLFMYSFIWNIIKSEEKTSLAFQNSLLFKGFQGLFDKLINFLRRLFNSISGFYEKSLSGVLIGKLLAHFVTVISLYICIQTVVPYHLWHNQYSVILILGIFVIFIIKASIDSRYCLNLKKLDFAMVLYILTILIAAATSITPAASLKTFLFNIMIFIFVYVMVNSVRTKEELGSILLFIIAAVTFASFYGIWQYINHVPVDPRLVDINTFGAGVPRVYSTMGNPNDYAEYIILTLPFFAAVFFNAKNIILKVSVFSAFLLSFFNLIVTGSRSGLLGFIVAVLVYVFLKNRKLIPAFILLGVCAIPFVPNSIIIRMQTIGKDSSSVLRLDIWKGSWALLKDYWFTGVGIGPQPFMKLFNNYAIINKPPHSHMLPLQIWIELGVAGIASFVWFLARIIKKGVTSVFSKRDSYLNNIIIANIASIFGLITIGFVEYVWFNPRILNMFWINIGIFLIALNLSARQASKSNA